MEDTAAHPSPPKETVQGPSPGELIIQNGRLKGTRRALGPAVTFLGKAPSCDICLNVDGVSSLHCVIVHANDTLLLRDLESETGTIVNDERVAQHTLRDGDLVTVGPFQFRVRIPRPKKVAQSESPRKIANLLSLPADVLAEEKEGLRIQAAAVAAQQSSLFDQEMRLQQQQVTLEEQESQLSAHLEEKRQRLLELHNQAQASRATLQRDKEIYERYVNRVTGDLSLTEREILAKQQQCETEYKRLLTLRRKLKQRFHRHWHAEREQMRKREQDVTAAARTLEQEQTKHQQDRAALQQACMRFNGDMELGRRQLKDEWDRLHLQHRELKEQRERYQGEYQRLVLQLEERELQLNAAQQAYQKERHEWEQWLVNLRKEAEGLENRVRNQRRKLHEQQLEIEQRVPAPSEAPPVPSGAAASSAPTIIDVESTPVLPSRALMLLPASTALDAAAPTDAASGLLTERAAELERIADQLQDQRSQLTEQWDKLAQMQASWQTQRDAMAQELSELTTAVHQRAQHILEREQLQEASFGELKQQHAEMVQWRQHLLGWQTRLRAREAAWEGERERMVAELRAREELAEKHLQALLELRHRWARRRRDEMEDLRSERSSCERTRREYNTLREDRRRKLRAVEEERRHMSGKAIALEQYRQECVSSAVDAAAAERRIDRLTRRWFADQATAIRAATKDEEEAQLEMRKLLEYHETLQRRLEDLSNEKLALAEQLAEWEHNQLQAVAEQDRLRQEVQTLVLHRSRSEQLVLELRNELERIARSLLDEPEPPTILRAFQEEPQAETPAAPGEPPQMLDRAA